MSDHSGYISTPIDYGFHEGKQQYPIHCVGSCIPVMNPIKDLASVANEERLDLWRNLHSRQHHISRRFEAFVWGLESIYLFPRSLI